MNEFQSTQSGAGLLKDYYGGVPEEKVARQLKKRREKLYESRVGSEEEKEE